MNDLNNPPSAGFVFVRHVRALEICTTGARRFLLDHGLSNEEIQDFFDNGMTIEKFESLFGNDAMAQQVIERAKQDG